MKALTMKTDLDTRELADTLQAQAARKVDYMAPARKLVMTHGAELASSSIGAGRALALTDTAHSQVASFLDIPRAYYDRMRTVDPELLSENVNHWMQRADPKARRLIRTLDGNVRALLSDAYQRIDNLEVGEAALAVIAKIPGIRIASASITENRLYIKAVSSAITAKVEGSKRVGDIVEAGVMISNSETGLGSISVKPFMLYLACLNGMVRDKESFRAAHVGRRADPEIEGMLTARTRQLQDRAFIAKLQDVTRAAFDRKAFDEFMAKVSGTTGQQIGGHVPDVVETLASTFKLGEGEKTSILDHLIRGGDLSRFGLVNAVTRTAEDSKSYDRATELETLGANLVELPSAGWTRLEAKKPTLV